MSVILLAGGSGLIGTRLQTLFKEHGHTVRLLTRTPKGADQFAWNPEKGEIDRTALKDADIVVNLAGTGIADKRWTAQRKKSILESRVKSAEVIRQALEETGYRPQHYISASGMGYYGDSGERLMVEDDQPVRQDFLSTVCVHWERAACSVGNLGIPVSIIRVGIVLSKEGGALKEIMRPVRFGVGAYFGDGSAWYSWIHIDDICRIFLWVAQHTPAVSPAIYNGVAPHPARNKDFVRSIARALHMPFIPAPAPGFAMRLVLGEMADVVLNSNLVSSAKVEKAGFQFLFPELDEALSDIMR